MTLEQSNQTKKHMGAISKNNINNNSNVLEEMSFKENNSMENNTFLKPFFKSNSEEYNGYVYINEDIKPFMKVKVRHTYYSEFHQYYIRNETMQFVVLLTGGDINYIIMSYNLSGYHDVDERLFHFGKIRKCINSNNLFIKMVEHEENNLTVDLNRNNKELNTQKKQTEYWIEWVKKISKIEKYYDVKFYLPKKASESDYLAIEVLSDSIDGKPCRMLPSLKMKKPFIKRAIKLDEKMYIGDGTYMLNLSLFGYIFKPKRQYVVPGQYVWDRKYSGWIEEKSNGVPVGVDFEISYEEEKNRKLIEYIDFEQCDKEFDLEKIVRLDGKKEELFIKYTDFTYSFHNNRKLFLDYQDALYTLYEMREGSMTQKSNYVSIRITDEIVANRLINNVVSYGKQLVDEIDNMMRKVCGIDSFSLTFYKDNLGYYWLNILHKYSIEGVFLISIGKDREIYYDYKSIMKVAKEKDDAILLEVAKSFNGYKGNSSDSGITLYELMRNYSYTVAKIQKEYYEQVYNIIIDYEKKVKKTILEIPELIQKKGRYNNYIAYILSSDSRNIHVFKRSANILSDYYRYKNDADKHFETQCIGKEKDIFI